MGLANASGAKLVFGLDITPRNSTTNRWDPTGARALMQYGIDNWGADAFWAFELGNEQNDAFSAQSEAEDYAVLQAVVEELWPAPEIDGSSRPRLIGPDPHGFHNNITEGVNDKTIQFLINFANNAVKFTSEGRVEVRVGRDGQDVVLTVSDTGTGIADTSTIFQRFTQEDASIARRFGGTGLGLSIIRELCSLMGGDVQVQSTQGQGSVFTVTLPAPVCPDITALDAPVAIEDLGRGLRVLVADDHPVNQLIARRVLEEQGFAVDLAADGERAVEAARAHRPDAVLMDLHMPGVDGLEATRQLRAEGYRGPIIALSADALAESRDACRDAGMTGFVGKPFRRAELLAALQEALQDEAA